MGLITDFIWYDLFGISRWSSFFWNIYMGEILFCLFFDVFNFQLFGKSCMPTTIATFTVTFLASVIYTMPIATISWYKSILSKLQFKYFFPFSTEEYSDFNTLFAVGNFPIYILVLFIHIFNLVLCTIRNVSAHLPFSKVSQAYHAIVAIKA